MQDVKFLNRLSVVPSHQDSTQKTLERSREGKQKAQLESEKTTSIFKQIWSLICNTPTLVESTLTKREPNVTKK